MPVEPTCKSMNKEIKRGQVVRWKKACSFEKVLCETLARRTRSLVYACACAYECVLVGLKVRAHILISALSIFVVGISSEKLRVPQECWLLRCVSAVMRVLHIMCKWTLWLDFESQEFSSKSIWIFSRNAAWIYSCCPKLIQTIKHAVWIEYYIRYAASISI